MIRLTRLNHVAMVLNFDLIEHIDVTPVTVICIEVDVWWLTRTDGAPAEVGAGASSCPSDWMAAGPPQLPA